MTTGFKGCASSKGAKGCASAKGAAGCTDTCPSQCQDDVSGIEATVSDVTADGGTYDLIVSGSPAPSTFEPLDDFNAGGPFSSGTMSLTDCLAEEEFDVGGAGVVMTGTAGDFAFYYLILISSTKVKVAICSLAEVGLSRGAVLFYGEADYVDCCSDYTFTNIYDAGDVGSIVTDPVIFQGGILADFFVVGYGGTLAISISCLSSP